MKISEMISVLIKVHQDFGKDVEIGDIRIEEGRLEIQVLNEQPPVDSKIPTMFISDKTGGMRN